MAGNDIRNIALVGHGRSGKTTLGEAMLVATKTVSRQGAIGDKNTVSDFADDERERGHSIDASLIHAKWKGKDFNIVDAPGYPDFVGQALRGLDAVDCAVIVIHAYDGVLLNTRRLYKAAGDRGIQRIVVVNRCDAENIDLGVLGKALDDLCGTAGKAPEECDEEVETPDCDSDCTLAVWGDVTVNSTAGEKERLTLEPVLFTPVDRRKLVLGKLLAVLTSIVAFMLNMSISLGLSILGLTLIAVKFMKDVSKVPTEIFAASAPQVGGYSIAPMDLFMVVLSILPIMILGASLQLAISTWARSNDEAYGYLNPLSFLSSLPMIVVLFIQDVVPALWHYAIPIFGTILAMRVLLIDKWSPAALFVMFIYSLIYAALALGWAVWMFGREEVVFRT